MCILKYRYLGIKCRLRLLISRYYENVVLYMLQFIINNGTNQQRQLWQSSLLNYKRLAIINILTASRLLSEPSHQLIMCELNECIILLCWKNKHLLALVLRNTHYELFSIPLKTNKQKETDLPALSSISHHTPLEFCPHAPSVVFHKSSQPAWGRIKVALFWWEMWHRRTYLLGELISCN